MKHNDLRTMGIFWILVPYLQSTNIEKPKMSSMIGIEKPNEFLIGPFKDWSLSLWLL